MNKLNWQFFIISFVAAFVVLYFIMIRQEGSTQEQALLNAFGGGVGMVCGLFIYNRFIKKDEEPKDLDD